MFRLKSGRVPRSHLKHILEAFEESLFIAYSDSFSECRARTSINPTFLFLQMFYCSTELTEIISLIRSTFFQTI